MERLSLIYVLLAEAAPSERKAAFDAFDGNRLDGAGLPIPPLFNSMDEATFWAPMASDDQRAACGLAIHLAMPPKRQADFSAAIARKTT